MVVMLLEYTSRSFVPSDTCMNTHEPKSHGGMPYKFD